MKNRGTNGRSSFLKIVLMTISMTASTQLPAFQTTDLLHGHFITQLGYYCGIQGQEQHINIQGAIGDTFSAPTNQGSSNGLFGLGYYIDGQSLKAFNMSYGLNFFYLAPTGVKGTVLQEDLFTNLAYSYTVTHFPLYVMAKSTIDTKSSRYSVTMLWQSPPSIQNHLAIA